MHSFMLTYSWTCIFGIVLFTWFSTKATYLSGIDMLISVKEKKSPIFTKYRTQQQFEAGGRGLTWLNEVSKFLREQGVRA